MYSQAINTIQDSKWALPDQYVSDRRGRLVSLLLIYSDSAAFPPSTVTQGDLCVPDKVPTLANQEV